MVDAVQTGSFSGTSDMEVSMSHPLFCDLSGQVFGLLTVVCFSHFDAWKNHYYKCRCVCGTEVAKRDTELKSGKFFTCGAMWCRFWEKVDKNGPVPAHKPELGPCWVWTGATNGGYGILKVPGEKRVVRAHIFSWKQENGPVPEGLFVLHHCDQRPCIRIPHLFMGTNQDNMKDMAAKGRAKGLVKIHLSPVEKDQMRADYQRGGITYGDLVERYGVSLQTVGRTLRGES